MNFQIDGRNRPLEVFTTRPDTLFGASFCALSADHPLTEELARDNSKLRAFQEKCRKLGTSAEAIETAEKLGFDTGIKVRLPVGDGRELPLYVANFVLMEYGTGAIFGISPETHEFSNRWARSAFGGFYHPAGYLVRRFFLRPFR